MSRDNFNLATSHVILVDPQAVEAGERATRIASLGDGSPRANSCMWKTPPMNHHRRKI